MNVAVIEDHVRTMARIARRPTLQEFIHVLRHPETWPEDFVWNYSTCDQCAMGLATRLWALREAGEQWSAPAYHAWAAHTFAIPYEEGVKIFFNLLPAKSWRRPFAPRNKVDVTPEQVAHALDRFLVNRAANAL